MRGRPTFLAVSAVALVAAGAFGLARSPLAGPPLLAATELGAYGFEPGELVADFTWKAVDGRKGDLADLLDGNRALVVVLRTTECPVSRRYGHRVAEMEEAWADRGVAFAYLSVSPQDTREKIEEDVATYGFDGPYIADPEGRIGDVLQTRVSTEVYVVDAAGTIRYRGAVDDQFGITFSNPVVGEAWLEDALEAVVGGTDVATPRTEASGCYLERDPAAAAVPARPVTWHGRVSRIVQESCVGCHHEGGVAPFSLETYEQAYGFRQMIQWVVEEGRMPPWFASPDHGEWSNDPTLEARDRRDLLAWIEAGAPEGDSETAPLPRTFVEGWQLPMEPDTVIPIPEPLDVPADGVVDYKYVYVKTDWAEDRWIEALELSPTALEQTHHIIVYLEGPDDERRGLFFGGWSPGMPPTIYPEGSGKRIPAGQWLMYEIHYTPNGRATEDRTRMALVFADEKPRDEVRTSAVATTEFEIPPHADNHEVVADLTFPRGGRILRLLPHMHLRGKAFRYSMLAGDGTEDVLLDVPRYDFNWQLWYDFAEPFRVEADDVMRGRAWYDNSEANPANPDPSVAVAYGEQSFEEMMFGFFEWIPDRKAESADGA